MKTIMLVILGIILSACANWNRVNGFTEEEWRAYRVEQRAICKAQGLIHIAYDESHDPVGCMTRDGFEKLLAAEAQKDRRIDPFLGLLLLQGFQSRSAYQYQPLPVPKLGTTCFYPAGSPVIQCY
jgi:hypothetical protein